MSDAYVSSYSAGPGLFEHPVYVYRGSLTGASIRTPDLQTQRHHRQHVYVHGDVVYVVRHPGGNDLYALREESTYILLSSVKITSWRLTPGMQWVSVLEVHSCTDLLTVVVKTHTEGLRAHAQPRADSTGVCEWWVARKICIYYSVRESRCCDLNSFRFLYYTYYVNLKWIIFRGDRNIYRVDINLLIFFYKKLTYFNLFIELWWYLL